MSHLRPHPSTRIPATVCGNRNHRLPATLSLEVDTGAGALESNAGDWDELLRRSSSNVPFLTSAWLLAWQETLGAGAALLVPKVYLAGRLVAIAAFEEADGELRFAAHGCFDYADLVIDDSLDPTDHVAALGLLLDGAAQAAERFRCFRLARMLEEQRTFQALEAGGQPFIASRIAQVGAPMMDMAVVDRQLSRKRLVQRERRFEKLGAVRCETLTSAPEALGRLDVLFDQHIRRWQETPTPSLFLDDARRQFYRAATRRMGAAGCLRLSTLLLDDTPAACHFGFAQAGTFTLYKPTFNLDLAKWSPGDVLLKRLMELARDEGLKTFDFTIGDEPYKMRFATRVRQVVSLHLGTSRLSALLRRTRSTARRATAALAKSIPGN